MSLWQTQTILTSIIFQVNMNAFTIAVTALLKVLDVQLDHTYIKVGQEPNCYSHLSLTR